MSPQERKESHLVSIWEIGWNIHVIETLSIVFYNIILNRGILPLRSGIVSRYVALFIMWNIFDNNWTNTEIINIRNRKNEEYLLPKIEQVDEKVENSIGGRFLSLESGIPAYWVYSSMDAGKLQWELSIDNAVFFPLECITLHIPPLSKASTFTIQVWQFTTKMGKTTGYLLARLVWFIFIAASNGLEIIANWTIRFRLFTHLLIVLLALLLLSVWVQNTALFSSKLIFLRVFMPSFRQVTSIKSS